MNWPGLEKIWNMLETKGIISNEIHPNFGEKHLTKMYFHWSYVKSSDKEHYLLLAFNT